MTWTSIRRVVFLVIAAVLIYLGIRDHHWTFILVAVLVAAWSMWAPTLGVKRQ